MQWHMMSKPQGESSSLGGRSLLYPQGSKTRLGAWRLLQQPLVLSAILLIVADAPWAQAEAVRVTPDAPKGGQKQGQPWAEVPETFKAMKIPDWPVPTDLNRWQDADRPKTRATLLACLGEMPPRPDPKKVRVLPKEDMGDYIQEHFEFH